MSARTLWFTGISGAGKSTISSAVRASLIKDGLLPVVLDGDEVRSGICSDLDFSEQGRYENVRRVAELARLLNQQGIVVLVALITPLERMRDLARIIIGAECFLEIHVKASLEHCIARDVKGLYARASAGLIPDFTGISSGFEQPLAANLVLDTELESIAVCAARALSLWRASCR